MLLKLPTRSELVDPIQWLAPMKSGKPPDCSAALVRAGEYDAEFALLRRGGVEWAFSDRDGDGRLDWVLISLDAANGLVTHVYEITGTMATLRPDAAGGASINWGSFTNSTLRDGFAAIAPTHWPDRARER